MRLGPIDEKCKAGWVEAFMMILLCGGFGYYKTEFGGQPHSSSPASFTFYAPLIAVILGVLSLSLYYCVTSGGRLRAHLENVDVRPKAPGREAVEESGTAVPLSTFDVRQLNTIAAVQKELRACWVINQGIAVIGLMSLSRTKDFATFLPYLAVSMALQVVMFPRLAAFVERTEEWRHHFPE